MDLHCTEMENHTLAQTPNVTGAILESLIEYSSKTRSGSRLMCRLKFLSRLHRERDTESIGILAISVELQHTNYMMLNANWTFGAKLSYA